MVAIALLALSILTGAASSVRIDPQVHRTLRQQNAVNLMITMKETPLSVLESIEETSFVSREELIDAMVSQLEEQATQSQASLQALLLQETSMSSTSFWISNQVYVQGASADLVEKLRTIPSIAEVREERVLPVPNPIQEQVVRNSTTVEWGITKIQATDVWAKGFTGQNVVVASIDTGVLGTHEALKANFRGDYGWYDPEKKAKAPYDGFGHGTHTMGTMVGAKGIGVAPGAKWMACKGCRSEGCWQSELLDCAQFVTCPTDTQGKNRNCSKASHVVSNSWGGGPGGDDFYQKAVNVWQKAGIIPVFSLGNGGPACGSAGSPGDYANVIGVGAINSSDGLASFSSKGPSKSGVIKPEISAPGRLINSAYNSGDRSYGLMSGTSMAAPHVTGAIALLLSAKPGLKYEQVKQVLMKSVDTKSLQLTGQSCNGTVDGKFPNNNYGYGRLNVLKAISAPSPSPTPKPKPRPKPTPTPAPKPTPKSTVVSCEVLEQDACDESLACHWSWLWGCVALRVL